MAYRNVMIASPIHPIPPQRGAAVEWWMYQVAQRIRSCEMALISIADGAYPRYERVGALQIYRIRIGRLYKRLFQKWTRLDPFSYAKRAAAICRKCRFHIVHVHNDVPLFVALSADLPTAHLILHLHNERDVSALPGDVHLVVVSEYLRQYYRRLLPTAKIDRVTNGAEYTSAQETSLLSTWRMVLNNKKVVLYAGRISPEKGVIELVKAFQLLVKQRSDVVLVIAGEFSTRGHRAEYGAAVQQACAQLGEACLQLGIINPVNMPQVFQAADLVVVPSRFEEPLGMVMLEAMGQGKPVLVARRGGMTEVISAGQTGFLIDDITHRDQFATQMSQLLDNPEQLRLVGKQAQAYIEQHHSWDVVVQQLEAVYAEYG